LHHHRSPPPPPLPAPPLTTITTTIATTTHTTTTETSNATSSNPLVICCVCLVKPVSAPAVVITNLNTPMGCLSEFQHVHCRVSSELQLDSFIDTIAIQTTCIM